MINRPNTKAQRLHRHKRVRGKVSGTPERPRLNVFRSETNLYAQIIDDTKGVTLVSASSLEKGFEGSGTDKWGIKVNRVEVKNIVPPQEIMAAMERQMKAEREKLSLIHISPALKTGSGAALKTDA